MNRYKDINICSLEVQAAEIYGKLIRMTQARRDPRKQPTQYAAKNVAVLDEVF